MLLTWKSAFRPCGMPASAKVSCPQFAYAVCGKIILTVSTQTASSVFFPSVAGAVLLTSSHEVTSTVKLLSHS